MRKRKSTRETKNMTQTALWLPRETHDQLKKAGGERGLGEEIRRRLQFLEFIVGVEQQPRDPSTDLLLNLIGRTARNLAADEPWWSNRITLDVFKLAINELLSDLFSTLGSKTEPPETLAKLQSKYGPGATPETISRMLVRAAFVEHANEGIKRDFGGDN
jgi:hypothetical protein